MSSHPPFRLRLTLALLTLALAGTTVGAAVLLGTDQDAPTTVNASALAPTGPPLVVGGIDNNPTAAETAGSGMRTGVLDKDAAIREERQNRADGRALRALAAQQADILEFAQAVADNQAAADTAPPLDLSPLVAAPTPTRGGGGGGGGNPVPNHDDDPLYVKLDNIATCESGQNPRAYNPDGPWYGAFQFRFDTWQSYGGGGRRGQDIFNYSYREQREVAANLAQARGFAGSWPTCAARYGYT
ncbi:MAG TPA: transglycosylase family protein [Acidimicrobiales bacterium]